MHNTVKQLFRAGVYAGILLLSTSCKDTDAFFSNSDSRTDTQTANTFNFSTTQKLDLIVDYSAFKVYGPVRFSVYNVNPIVGENTDAEYIDESIEPLFEAFTDEHGRYDATITLPAYAKVLYVVTRYLTISQRRMAVEVVNGLAKAVAQNDGGADTRAVATRAKTAGTSTNDMSQMYNFSFKINTSSGSNTGTRICKDWHTPLGTWNSASGRPDYLMNRATSNAGLLFSESEIDGLYEAACKALNSSSTSKDQYRESADLTLIKDSEVSITGLGSFTCWLNSLGYYYYTDATKPTKISDLDIIMLFPNTQDGMRYTNCDYNGSIGMVRGDAIQLMYYPNIKSGSYAGATKIFPKGTKIGFMVKSNGWGCIDQDHSFNYSGWKTKKLNIWASSTEGLSYCGDTGYRYPNTTGEARTAKFQYVDPSGKKYAIISVEDACDDKDYDDLLFALTPANAFAGLADVEDGKSSSTGVYAFEDRWPSRGDYDMNDLVVNVKDERTFDNNGKIKKQTFYFTTYQNKVELVNGLAVRLNTSQSHTVAMKKMAKGATATSQAVAATYETYTDSNTGKKVYYLADWVEDDLGATYILELTYSSAQTADKVAEVAQPFLFRKLDNGKQLEVHIPFEKPTSRMDTSLFGTEADMSNPSTGEYYVRSGLYPFAFYLSGTKAEAFFDTILSAEGENQAINTFYPTFLTWSSSRGARNEDWYLKSNKK
ncbi:MAG: LruC domain-containing protein [Bacteroidaceae bacterium]|nr:LruC domain-containing protein [Bacteroidaceae bacterium]